MPTLKDFEFNIDKAYETGTISEKTYNEAKALMNKPEKKASDLEKMGIMYVDNAKKTFEKTHPNQNNVAMPEFFSENVSQQLPKNDLKIDENTVLTQAPENKNKPKIGISKEEFLKKNPKKEDGLLSRYKQWAESGIESKTGFIPDEFGSVILTDPKTKEKLYFDSMDQDTLNDYKKSGFGVEYAASSGKDFEEGVILGPSDRIKNDQLSQFPSDQNTEIALGQEPVESMNIVGKPSTPGGQAPSAQEPVRSFGPARGGLANDPFKLIEQAADLEAQDELRVNEEKARIFGDKAKAQLERDKKLSEFKKQAAERIEAQNKKNQAAIDEYKNTKITVPSMWDDKSTGAKILAGIGLFLGAMPNSTGQNTAVAVLEKQIERNMDAQKQNLKRMKEGLEFNESILTNLYKQLGDEEDAINAYSNIQLNAIENELDRLTSISSNEKINANKLKMKGVIGQQREALRQQQEQNNISRYNAETNRMNVLLDSEAKHASKGLALTPGEEARDKEFGKDHAAWVSGGQSDALKGLNQIKQVSEALESGKANLTGRWLGRLPDFMTPEAAINTRELMQEVVQRNLRQILGAQFAEKEGAQLIARAFNPKLSEEANAGRVKRLMTQMELAYKQKEDMAKHFDAYGTLKGYRGQQPTMADFESALEGKSSNKGGVKPSWAR